jgi:hypothetical protein
MTIPSKSSSSRFADQLTAERASVLREFIDFLRHNKKWWMLPILLVFLVFGLLMLLGGSAAAPFIYTLF